MPKIGHGGPLEMFEGCGLLVGCWLHSPEHDVLGVVGVDDLVREGRVPDRRATAVGQAVGVAVLDRRRAVAHLTESASWKGSGVNA